MCYLNVQLAGLSGQPHPILHNICTTQEVKMLQLHINFLTCDYQTNKNCPTQYVLVACMTTAEVRRRLYPELLNTITDVQPECEILNTQPPTPPSVLLRFISDCTSINLPESYRIPAHNQGAHKVYKISRDWCFAVHSERSHILKL